MNQFSLRKITLTFLINFFLLSSLLAQVFQGQVIDIDTKEPLAFVQIGVESKKIGFLSDEKGQFQLNQKKILATDSLHFFYLGYASKKILVQDLLDLPNAKIALSKEIFSLPKVNIKEDALTKDKKLGHTKKGLAKTGWYGVTRNIVNNPVGERGSIIEIDGQTAFVKSVNFYLVESVFDSVVFRIHLYSIKDGLPHEELLTENVFVKTVQKKGWIKVPIEQFQLIVKEDLIATIEWVKAWKSEKPAVETDKKGLHFSLGFKGKLFWRDVAHQSEWNINNKFHLKIYLDTKTN